MKSKLLLNFILIITLLINNYVTSQNLQLNSLTNKYEIIVEKQFPKTESKKIFDNTSEWLALNFNGLNSSLKFSNFEKKRLIFTGSFEIKRSLISFVLHFTFTDNKYNCIITDFIVQNFTMNGLTTVSRMEEKMIGREKFSLSIEEQMKSILDNLNESIIKIK